MKMRIESKVRSIYSSLAIEANSLSLESVHSIVDSKMVFGNRKEIQEVKNANELYEHINEYNWKSEFDFLKAHTLMMKYFDDDNGYYRNHGEGVKRGDEIICSAPQSILVSSLEKITQKTTQKTTQKIMLNDNQLSIIELIKENSKITRNELANILNITPDGVKYNLKKLIDNGFIERVGPDNGGYWKIK